MAMPQPAARIISMSFCPSPKAKVSAMDRPSRAQVFSMPVALEKPLGTISMMTGLWKMKSYQGERASTKGAASDPVRSQESLTISQLPQFSVRGRRAPSISSMSFFP